MSLTWGLHTLHRLKTWMFVVRMGQIGTLPQTYYWGVNGLHSGPPM